MANSYFSFKKFTVNQEHCAMKVGTDGVLLGAWAPVEDAKSILDIGAGTGLVSLMLAQRNEEALITAIDIDKGAVLQSTQNFEASPWANRLQAIEADIHTFTPEAGKYDVIVSNPPFFVNSLNSPDKQRNLARHNDGLTHRDLLTHVGRLLSPDGVFSVILPATDAETLIQIGEEVGLYPFKMLYIIPKPGAVPKRTLLSFSFKNQPVEVSEMILELERHKLSDEYATLTKDFYLKL